MFIETHVHFLFLRKERNAEYFALWLPEKIVSAGFDNRMRCINPYFD